MTDRVTRRAALGGGLAVAVLPWTGARATSADLDAAIKEIAAGRPVRTGRIKLDLPPLIENGNAVPLTVSVDSPMTAADHVKAIHVFNEKNPQPHVFNAYLSPANGRATIATRIKLADTQKVVGLAEMSDGSLWSASADVIVTIAACIEEGT